MAYTIEISKIQVLFSLHKQGSINKRQTARKLNISRNTLKKYLSDFDELKKEKPEIYQNSEFIKDIKFTAEVTPRRFNHLSKLFYIFFQQIVNDSLSVKLIWKQYKIDFPEGYSYSQFAFHFSNWRESQNMGGILSYRYNIKSISNEDLEILKKWRRSKDKRKWEKAVVLIESNKMKPILHIAKKVERSSRIVKEWISIYKKDGINGLYSKKRKISEEITLRVEDKKSKLIKLIHETPSLHGINRTSWSLASLSHAYEKVHGMSVSKSSISEYIRSLGYSFKKAKKTLTSPDPLYREKLQKITSILSKLRDDERFFSIDEFGPFSIKIQGGRSLSQKGITKTYPQRQRSKGRIICTAALELSKNQITHFYSKKKNTVEMIKLLEILLKKYKGVKRIYFSWDAASWHASKDLYKKLKAVNCEKYRCIHNSPIVELAPLPSSAQFLNVIESVFSGMARAIIHNSDYQSINECKTAIDLYFVDRNKHFKANPKRAGNKIWGKEVVKSEFSESQNCKDPKWR